MCCLVTPWHCKFYQILINKLHFLYFCVLKWQQLIDSIWHSKYMKVQRYLYKHGDTQAQRLTQMFSYPMPVRTCLEEIWIIRICMCLSCLSLFPSCYAILYSLPAILKIYYTSNSISYFSFIHFAFCFFSPMLSPLFLACPSWEILLWGHL